MADSGYVPREILQWDERWWGYILHTVERVIIADKAAAVQLCVSLNGCVRIGLTSVIRSEDILP